MAATRYFLDTATGRNLYAESDAGYAKLLAKYPNAIETDEYYDPLPPPKPTEAEIKRQFGIGISRGSSPSPYTPQYYNSPKAKIDTAIAQGQQAQQAKGVQNNIYGTPESSGLSITITPDNTVAADKTFENTYSGTTMPELLQKRSELNRRLNTSGNYIANYDYAKYLNPANEKPKTLDEQKNEYAYTQRELKAIDKAIAAERRNIVNDLKKQAAEFEKDIQRGGLVQKAAEAGAGQVMNNPLLKVLTASLKPELLLSAAEVNDNAKKKSALNVVQHYIESLEKLDNMSTQAGVRQFVQGISDTDWSDFATLGIEGIIRDFDVLDIAERAAEGRQISPEEQLALNAYQAFNEIQRVTPRNWSYDAGASMIESLPYMASFVIGGEVWGGVKKGAKQAVGATLTNRLSNVSKYIKTPLNITGKAATTTLTTPIFPQNYVEQRLGNLDFSQKDELGNIQPREYDDKDGKLLDMAQAFGLGMITNYAEQSGGAISTVASAFAKKTKNPIARQVAGLFGADVAMSNTFGQIVQKMQKSTAWNGIVPETFEEYVEKVSGLLLGDLTPEEREARRQENAKRGELGLPEKNWKEEFTWDEFLTIITSVGAMGGLFGAAKLAGTKRGRTPQQIADDLTNELSHDVKEVLDTVLAEKNPDERKKLLEESGVIEAAKTREDKKLIYEYMVAKGSAEAKKALEEMERMASAPPQIQEIYNKEQEAITPEEQYLLNTYNEARHENGKIYQAIDESGNEFIVLSGDTDGSAGDTVIVKGEDGKPRPASLATHTITEVPFDKFVEATNTAFQAEQELNNQNNQNNGQNSQKQGQQEVQAEQGAGTVGTETKEAGAQRAQTPRVLTADEAEVVISEMETTAEPAPELELTPENWYAEFSEDGTVETPLGKVKMGENQYLKLQAKGRQAEFGMIKPTLTNPDIVLEEADQEENVERNSKLLFIKSFTRNGEKIYHFESVTVSKNSSEVVISNHIIELSALRDKLQSDQVLYIKDAFAPNSSELRLTENQNGLSDIVPTQGANPSANKVTTSKQENQAPQSAISKIQKNEKGKPLFEQSEPEVTADAFTEMYDSEATQYLDQKIEKLTEQTKKPKLSGDTEKDFALMEKWSAQVEAVQQSLEYWKKVREVFDRREAEAKEQAAFEEAEKRQQEQRDKEAAASTETPPEILAELADKSWEIKELVAGNPSTPVELLGQLSQKPNPYKVRAAVARNPSTPTEILESMKDDTYYTETKMGVFREVPEKRYPVLEALAENPNTDKNTLERLSNMGNSFITERAVNNPNYPTAEIAERKRKAEERERQQEENFAREREEAERRLAEDAAEIERQAQERIAEIEAAEKKEVQNPETEPTERAVNKYTGNGREFSVNEIYPHRLKNFKSETRVQIAADKDVLAETLSALVRDTAESVRAAAAKNPKLQNSQYRALAKDKSALVRAAIAYNENTPDAIFNELMQDESVTDILTETISEDTPQRITDVLLSSPKMEIRQGLAMRADRLPAEAQIRLLSDSDNNVKLIALEKTEAKAESPMLVDENNNEFPTTINNEKVPFHKVSAADNKKSQRTIQRLFDRLAQQLSKSGLPKEFIGFDGKNPTQEDIDRLRANPKTRGIADFLELVKINNDFNAELQQQIDGSLPTGHTYKLGNAGAILRSAGLPDLPIELRASRLSDKSMQENHPFDLSEVKGLPRAIQNPLAVFRSATHIGSFVVLTEIQHEGKNFVVAIEANRQKGKIEVNSVRSVYPKNSGGIVDWINSGLLEYANKDKMKNRLSQQRSNSADVRKAIVSATKIIKDFENPKISEKNLEGLRLMSLWHGSGADFDKFSNDKTRLMRTRNGEVYGFTDGENIYYDKNLINLNTPIHEVGSLWVSFVRKNHPELWAKIRKEVQGTPYWNDVLNSPAYEHLRKDKNNLTDSEIDDIAHEAFETAMGDKGESVLRSNMPANEKTSMYLRLRKLLKEAWDWIGKQLRLRSLKPEQIEKLTFDDLVNGAVADVLRGETIEAETDTKIAERTKEIQRIKNEAIKDGTFMKAPNGKDTKLNERQWLQVRTKEFKEWFGDWENDPENASKVIDENGEPLVVYHGTGAKFSVFKNKENWFTSDIQYAMQYAKLRKSNDGDNSSVMSAFLNIRNMLDGNYFPSSLLNNEAFYNKYDGWANKNPDGELDHFVVSNPNQIKSATDNNGNFDSRNPDIRYRIIGEKSADNSGDKNASIAQARKVSDFIMDVLDGKIKNGRETIELPKQAHKLAEKVLGHPIKSHRIGANEIRHINNKHGENGTKNTENSIPLRKEDIALIPYIMGAPDRVEKSRNNDRGTESIKYYKNLSNGHIVVIERELGTGSGKMENITMWADKKHSANAVHTSNNSASHATSETHISENDITKIQKDFESAIEKEQKNSLQFLTGIKDRQNIDSDDAKLQTLNELTAIFGVKPRIIADVKKDLTPEDAELRGMIESEKPKGYHDTLTDEVGIILPNNKTAKEVQETYLHEVVGHYGLRGLLGDKFDSVMEQVFEVIPEEDRKKLSYLKNNKVSTAEEFLSRIAEKGNEYHPNLIQKIINFFKDALRKMGVKIRMTNDDILSLIQRSKDRLRKNSLNLQERTALKNDENKSPISNGSTQTQQRGGDGLSEQSRQTADKFRRGTEKARDELSKNSKKHLTYDEKINIEKRVAFDIAKEGGLWIDDIYTLGDYFRSGNENTALLNIKENAIYKSNNLNNTFGSIEELIKTIEAHNLIFPETKYEIIGFTGTEGNTKRAPYIEVVLKQPFIDKAEGATPQEISDYMLSLGFEKINDRTFENEEYVVSDLKPENVLKNENGTIFVIDNRIETKKKVPKSELTARNAHRLGINLRRSDGTPETSQEQSLDEINIPDHIANPQAPETPIKNIQGKTRLGRAATWFNEQIVDTYVRLKKTIREYERRTGKKIEDKNNPYQRLTKMSARVQAAIEAFKRERYYPILNAIKKLSEKLPKTILKGEKPISSAHKAVINKSDTLKRFVSAETAVDKFSLYLQAKHAPYRNAYLKEKAAEKEKAAIDNGSGWTDEEAKVAVELFEAYFTEEEIKNLWELIEAATDETLKNYLHTGQIDIKTHDKIKEKLKYYVPLRGWDVSVTDEAIDSKYSNNVDKVYSPFKTAKGRKTIADNPIAYILQTAQSAILFREKNDINKIIYAMVRRGKQNDIATINKIYILQTLDPDGNVVAEEEYDTKPTDIAKNQRVTTKRDWGGKHHIAKHKAAEHVVPVYIDGERFNIIFQDEQVGNSINNPYSKASEMMQRTWVADATRFMSSLNTQKSPPFIIKNAARDIQQASARLYVLHGGKMTRSFFGELPGVAVALFRGNIEMNPEYKEYYKEYAKSGSRVGFVQMLNIDSLKRDIESTLKHSSKQGIDDVGNLKKALRLLAGLSAASEDVSRFSAFIAARKMGKDVEEASNIAKEVSVNFNRRGRQTGVFNSLYSFFNASVQAVANTAELYRKNWKRALVVSAGHVALGYATYMFNSSILGGLLWGSDGDDDDDNLKNMTPYRKYTNLFLPVGKRGFALFPLSQTWRPFFAIGVAAAQIQKGEITVKEAAKNLGEQFGNWSPIEIGIDLTAPLTAAATAVAPTFIQPIVQSALTKKNFMGIPLVRDMYNKEMNENTPNYLRGVRKDLPVWWGSFARMLMLGDKSTGEIHYNNRKTGKPDELRGINISPDQLQNAITGYLGGLGKFGEELFNVAYSFATGGEVTANKIPIASSFYNEVQPSYYTKKFYRIKEAYNKWHNSFSRDMKTGRASEYAETPAVIDLFVIEDLFKIADIKMDAAKEKELEKTIELWNQKDKELEKISLGEKTKTIQQIREEQEQIAKEMVGYMEPVFKKLGIKY